MQYFTLRIRLLFLILLIGLPAMGMAAFFSQQDIQSSVKQAQTNSLRLAQLLANSQDARLAEVDQLLTTLFLVDQNISGPGCSQALQQIQQARPEYRLLAIVDADGYSRCSSLIQSNPPRFNLAASGNTPAGIESSLFVDNQAGRTYLQFWRQQNIEGASPTTALAEIELSTFAKIVLQGEQFPEVVVNFLDSNGLMIAAIPEDPDGIGKILPLPDLIQLIRAAPPGGGLAWSAGDRRNFWNGTIPELFIKDRPPAAFPDPAGQPHLYSYAKSNGPLEFSVVISQQLDSITHQGLKLFYEHITVLSIVTLLTLLAAWMLSWLLITRRLRRLEETTQRISSGDLAVRSGLSNGDDEISSLARTVDFLAASLQASDIQLKQEMEQNRQAKEQIQKQYARLEGLQQISLAASSNLHLDDALRQMLDSAITLLQVDAADFLLIDFNTDSLVFRAGAGFRTSLAENIQMDFMQGFQWKTLQNPQPVAISDLDSTIQEWREHRQQISPNFVHLIISEGFKTYAGCRVAWKGTPKGILEVYTRSPKQVDEDWLKLMQMLVQPAAVAVDNAMLFEDQIEAMRRMESAYDETIRGWARMLEKRDLETEGHCERVAEITCRIVESMGMPPHEIKHVWRGALLHDIGKMGLPDHVLLKLSSLSAEEWDLMHLHPVYAYEWLAPIPFLQPALDIPYCHHERWDGGGYPRQLRGSQIPISARIFSVVDVWDALSSDRRYRRAWPETDIIRFLRAESGTQFDPDAVNSFLAIKT